MGFRKNKHDKTPVEIGPTPYEIGLHGSVEALYQADKAAKADVAAKKAAYDAHRKKSTIYSISKRSALRDAYDGAKEVPYEVHQELQKGAVQAFIEERPENLQEILSHPEDFRVSQWASNDDRAIIATLIDLMGQLADPGTPALALAKVGEDKKQDILDDTLYTLVDRYTDIEGPLSTLLKANAKAGHDSSVTLAAAFHKGQPSAVVNMLLENGANFEEALQTMRASPKHYGDCADRIEFLKYKEETQATIQKLQETIEELTAPKKTRKPKPSQPKPSTTAQTGKKFEHLKKALSPSP